MHQVMHALGGLGAGASRSKQGLDPNSAPLALVRQGPTSRVRGREGALLNYC